MYICISRHYWDGCGFPPAGNFMTFLLSQVWDERLARSAEAWASQCIWAHGPSQLMRYVGQNLSVHSGRWVSPPFTPSLHCPSFTPSLNKLAEHTVCISSIASAFPGTARWWILWSLGQRRSGITCFQPKRTVPRTAPGTVVAPSAPTIPRYPFVGMKGWWEK